MKINKIIINNFKSIYGNLELNFGDIKGFWKISGTIGAGKTTIGEAIIFGLFGDVKGKNNKELISWGKKNGSVHIECTSKGYYLQIHRDICGELKILVDNKPIIYINKRDAQKQLETTYYDISRVTLELLCIISFNNFKSLSNMTPAEIRMFLDQVFGFSKLTNYVEICKIEKQKVFDLLNDKINKKNNLFSQIEKIKKLSEIQHIDGDITSVKAEINKINDKIKDIDLERANKIAEIKNKLKTLQEELSKIRILGENKAKEIKFIEQGKCPTCGANIDQSQLEIKKYEREELLNHYKIVSDKIKSITKIIADINSEYENKREIENNNKIEFSRLLIRLEEQIKRNKINVGEIEEIKKEILEIENEINNINIDLQEWTQLIENLSNNIRQQILSGFVPSLNSCIQEYISQFNMHYTVEFDNQFKCTIKMFGIDNVISTSSLSTGQLKTVDMCIILGVLKVIFSKINFNILFLDELFSNFDSALHNVACGILKNELKENQTIFIISHQEISDSLFDGSIKAKLNFIDGQEASKYIIESHNSIL